MTYSTNFWFRAEAVASLKDRTEGFEMTEKVLRVLEYDKITERLAERASSQLGKELASALVPFTQLEQVQSETEGNHGCGYLYIKKVHRHWGHS